MQAKGNGNGAKAAEVRCEIRQLKIAKFPVTIRSRGECPLVCHAWDAKAREWLGASKAARKEMNVKKKDNHQTPEQQCEAATYRLPDGRPGFPTSAIRSAMIAAAHKDLGITKTDICKGVFIESKDGQLLEIKTKRPPVMGEHICVNDDSTPSVRYRPMFYDWQMTFDVEYDAAIISPDTIVNLIERAGYGVGIGESRPERKGQWGRFEVVRD